MGQVFRATDTRLKRQVAIEILPPSLGSDASTSPPLTMVTYRNAAVKK